MSSLLYTAGKASRLARASPISNNLLRRGVHTLELDQTKGDRERVVILGSGWAGFVLSRELDKTKFQTVVVSPRTYFVFTPLLASTAVGTLEFRTTLESVRARRSGVDFIHGWGAGVDFNEKTLRIEEPAIREIPTSATPGDVVRKHGDEASSFLMKYDKLVIAVGCYSQTFNTPGVRENALFLKDVVDAVKIRKRILECFEYASLPTTSDAMRKTLLNFVIVGGGPTGVEFAAELFDLCHEDLKKLYPTLVPLVKISLYDVAPKILPMFDTKLSNYAIELFKRDGIDVKTQHNILELRRGLPGAEPTDRDAGCFTLKTKQNGEIGIGMCVWSTGLMMNPFVKEALSDVKTYPTASAELENAGSITNPSAEEWAIKRHRKTGGLLVDDHFRVQIVPKALSQEKDGPVPQAMIKDVFALGDVSTMEKDPLPATAQVANQEAKWLGRNMNNGFTEPGFNFRSLGVMTYLGDMKAIMQTGRRKEIKGRTAWLIWRGAYLTQTMSWRNRMLIPIYWLINWLFGRDISRF